MAHFANKSGLHVLLVKTSSLGDVLHNLPTIDDIMCHCPNAQIDWVVEEKFISLPKLHPSVCTVIPVAIRRWRNSLFSRDTWDEISTFLHMVNAQRYDVAIDTQGLLKSALITHSIKTLRCGFDRTSAREQFASLFYDRRYPVNKNQHAVERNRQLVAQSLGYTLRSAASYGIHSPDIVHPDWLAENRYTVLLHATSRIDKLWNEFNWIALGEYLNTMKLPCVLPWGNAVERQRSQYLCEQIPNAICPPELSLDEVTALLGNAHAVIGVDTGLSHLATALGVPTVGIYTATDPSLTGLYGSKNAINLGGVNAPPDVAAVISALEQIAPC